ncbi:hypothetical protein CCACVL1_30064 [Corchorus capsularis]|uniref:Uncharacterized protein n=1 Tax=Corchorus capsularis TaxID=210143 RepID=A0A1R3FYV5_COCAP|nr:hypothetical protein CCACVL1_30064 [Corchorus capsularis]
MNQPCNQSDDESPLTTHLVSSSDNPIFADSATTISPMNSHFSALTCRPHGSRASTMDSVKSGPFG